MKAVVFFDLASGFELHTSQHLRALYAYWATNMHIFEFLSNESNTKF
jgi:hypothetical protein